MKSKCIGCGLNMGNSLDALCWTCYRKQRKEFRDRGFGRLPSPWGGWSRWWQP